MPETNSHGPARVQMTPEHAASLGLTPPPESTAPAYTPADQVKPEDIGTLSIEYRDGRPVIVVSGGKTIPAALTVVDEAGNQIAAYEARNSSRYIGQFVLHCHILDHEDSM
ncbi:hypothetical protein ACWEF9_18400 [Streptomyces sp. NPDC004980]